MCLSDYCDIFRCEGYLPSNVTAIASDLDLAALSDIEAYRSLYPDLKVPKALVGESALIPAPPAQLLDLLNIQQSGRLKDKYPSAPPPETKPTGNFNK